jgi:hypothetical protein
VWCEICPTESGGPGRGDSRSGRGLDRLSGGDRDQHCPTTRARPSRLGGTLALVGDLRRLAYDRSLDDADRALRIGDRFGVYDGLIDDE